MYSPPCWLLGGAFETGTVATPGAARVDSAMIHCRGWNCSAPQAVLVRLPTATLPTVQVVAPVRTASLLAVTSSAPAVKARMICRASLRAAASWMAVFALLQSLGSVPPDVARVQAPKSPC